MHSPVVQHEFNQFLARSESLDYEPDQQRLVQIGKLSKADLAKFKVRLSSSVAIKFQSIGVYLYVEGVLGCVVV
jgi:hypothetical protein